jgi:cyclophilin family peptidyl-prolyl cis-trans isomerase
MTMPHGRTILAFSLGCAALLGISVLSIIDAAAADAAGPAVVLDTTAGPIIIELDAARAPISTENFLKYVDAGFYDGLIFHRVIPGFMIQGGGFDEQLREKSEGMRPPIRNESGRGLSNQRGTIAMARTNDPNSATSQFFINLVDNANLDDYGGGYAVFGKVVAGLDAVDAIARVPTGRKNSSMGPLENVPLKPVVIKTARRKANP